MLMLPVLSLLLAAVLYGGSRTIIDDMRRREAVSHDPTPILSSR
jgi:hypothetical protein